MDIKLAYVSNEHLFDNMYYENSPKSRAGGRCKILGVLMTFCSALGTNLEIFGVLSAIFPPIFRNIGGAIAPPVPPALKIYFSPKMPLPILNAPWNPKDKQGATGGSLLIKDYYSSTYTRYKIREPLTLYISNMF